MNTQTGDIFSTNDKLTMDANFGKPLTQHEAVELRSFDNVQERLRRYKQSHADDTCGQCGLTLRAHSLREWQHCESKASHGNLVAHLNTLKS